MSVVMLPPLRQKVSAPGHYEVWLNERDAASANSAAESLADGHSVHVQKLASAAECCALKLFAAAAHNRLYGDARASVVYGNPSFDDEVVVGRARMALSSVKEEADGGGVSSLETDGLALCEALFVRSLALLDDQLPTLHSLLFGSLPLTCSTNDELTFSQGEPAINVYTRGGDFRAHTDKQSLTILLVLSDEDEFEGGGTAFFSDDVVTAWKTSRDEKCRADDRSETPLETPLSDPSTVLRPPAGTALCFAGQVMHSGVRVDSGKRVVLVASFSNVVHSMIIEGVRVNLSR
jgi:hypothetical protein